MAPVLTRPAVTDLPDHVVIDGVGVAVVGNVQQHIDLLDVVHQAAGDGPVPVPGLLPVDHPLVHTDWGLCGQGAGEAECGHYDEGLDHDDEDVTMSRTGLWSPSERMIYTGRCPGPCAAPAHSRYFQRLGITRPGPGLGPALQRLQMVSSAQELTTGHHDHRDMRPRLSCKSKQQPT